MAIIFGLHKASDIGLGCGQTPPCYCNNSIVTSARKCKFLHIVYQKFGQIELQIITIIKQMLVSFLFNAHEEYFDNDFLRIEHSIYHRYANIHCIFFASQHNREHFQSAHNVAHFGDICSTHVQHLSEHQQNDSRVGNPIRTLRSISPKTLALAVTPKATSSM